MVARAIVKPDGMGVPLRLLNLRDKMITIPKGTKIAEMERIPDDAITTVASTQEGISETTTGTTDSPFTLEVWSSLGLPLLWSS